MVGKRSNRASSARARDSSASAVPATKRQSSVASGSKNRIVFSVGNSLGCVRILVVDAAPLLPPSRRTAGKFFVFSMSCNRQSRLQALLDLPHLLRRKQTQDAQHFVLSYGREGVAIHDRRMEQTR